MRSKRLGSLGLGYAVAIVNVGLFAFATGPAWSFAPRREFGDLRSGLELASHTPLRLGTRPVWDVPKDRASAWERFKEEVPGAWRAYFDKDTHTPGRIFGVGPIFPGTSKVPEVAARVSIEIISKHLDLLAPGAAIGDLKLVSNDFDRESRIRTVAFTQNYRGLRVIDGQLSLRFKDDRLFVVASEAWPNVSVDAGTEAKQADEVYASAAKKWLEQSLSRGTQSAVAIEAKAISNNASDLSILPTVEASGRVSYHTVVRSQFETTAPVGRWDVYVDAASGKPFAMRQTLHFASGTLSINAPDRNPLGARQDVGAAEMNITVGGQSSSTDMAGQVTWSSGDSVAVVASVQGKDVTVQNRAGSNATSPFTLMDRGASVWNGSQDELLDAQLVTFVSVGHAKYRAREIAPDLRWLFDEVAPAVVNTNDSCNAYSDGTTVNFFRSSGDCQNTGRIPDVVYHEFGHSFHGHSIIEGAGAFDDSLSEGIADYFASSITKDPGVGRGFFFNNEALRDIDPADHEAFWPNDISGDPHETGLIISGALWDLRKALAGTMGADAAGDHVDYLMYQILKRAADIPSTYVEVVAADDDDNDLSNGTPNLCAINAAFALHGLADPTAVGAAVELPKLEGLNVVLGVPAIPQGSQTCERPSLSGATIEWRIRDQAGAATQLAMTKTARGFEANLPNVPDGTVIQYRVLAKDDKGTDYAFPNNRADPFYEIFVGDVVPLYCTDFEQDPGPGGWSSALVSGADQEGANDWQWGTPAGTSGSEDPKAAYSGTKVYGNDLGGGNFNGKYQSGKVNVLRAPEVDTAGYSNVRLQYRRWLTVEDGLYDQAEIYSNSTRLWGNHAGTSDQDTINHEDREWRFQDVDLSSTVRDGKVAVSFQLSSDQGLEFGGWNIDDFCVVAYDPTVPPKPKCGDNHVDTGEECDDGNLTSGDGCDATCHVEHPSPVCGNGTQESGEQCDDGNVANGDGCSGSCTIEVPAKAVCGDGQITTGEECDDGNIVNGDGCESDCTWTKATPNTPEVPETPTTPETNTDGSSSQDNGASGTLDVDDGGCGCRATSDDRSESSPFFVLAGLAWAVSRRRRKL